MTLSRFRLFRVRSPLLAESLLFSLPPGTEMVHFPGFALSALCIETGVTDYESAGFPHSETSESRVVCTSSELIAAYHVLHRLHAPRHPPCALSSLTIKFAHHKLSVQHIFLTPSLYKRRRYESDNRSLSLVRHSRSSSILEIIFLGILAYSIVKDHLRSIQHSRLKTAFKRKHSI